MKDKYLITLIGVKQAKKGYTFIYNGPTTRCKDCAYYQVCIKNLEVGRIYKVLGLRENFFPCELHDSGVRVVEVTESDILATLPSKLAIEGVVVFFNPQECVQTCENYEMCVPRGLFKGDRCSISEIGENVACPKGLSLVKVFLRRLTTTVHFNKLYS